MSAWSKVADITVNMYLHGMSAEEFDEKYFPIKDFPEENVSRGQMCQRKIFESGEMFVDYLPHLKKIEKPSLLIVGKYDPVCCAKQRDYFKWFVVNGIFVELENSGHFPRYEEPQAYTSAIEEFMNSLNS